MDVQARLLGCRRVAHLRHVHGRERQPHLVGQRHLVHGVHGALHADERLHLQDGGRHVAGGLQRRLLQQHDAVGADARVQQDGRQHVGQPADVHRVRRRVLLHRRPAPAVPSRHLRLLLRHHAVLLHLLWHLPCRLLLRRWLHLLHRQRVRLHRHLLPRRLRCAGNRVRRLLHHAHLRRLQLAHRPGGVPRQPRLQWRRGAGGVGPGHALPVEQDVHHAGRDGGQLRLWADPGGEHARLLWHRDVDGDERHCRRHHLRAHDRQLLGVGVHGVRPLACQLAAGLPLLPQWLHVGVQGGAQQRRHPVRHLHCHHHRQPDCQDAGADGLQEPRRSGAQPGGRQCGHAVCRHQPQRRHLPALVCELHHGGQRAVLGGHV